VASFGAVVCDGFLYVYGGHTARRHDYSTQSVSGRFHRLDLRQAAQWEELPGGMSLQGMNLATHGGMVYRAGGMAPRNAPGEPSDNRSVADVARFDPATRAWEPLPPLPRPRSSHDVVVVRDQLMVIGGWWQKGREAGPEWFDTMDILDLSSTQPQWRTVPQPFARRALIVAALDDEIFVIGGFGSGDDESLDVDVYDLSTQSWSKGPSSPGEIENGFAPAACNCQGSIYLSVGTGEMFRLSSDRQSWEPFAQTSPRIVHRMLPHGSEILIAGGAHGSKMSNLVEAVRVLAPMAGAAD
jgi:N-acetylneuraminic acid mutarotase